MRFTRDRSWFGFSAASLVFVGLMVSGCAQDASTPQGVVLAPESSSGSAQSLSPQDTPVEEPKPVSSISEISLDAGSVSSQLGTSGGARLRTFSAKTIEEWNRALDQLARASKRGERSVAMRRVAVSAFGARTDAEFRDALSRLPVIVTNQSGLEAGVAGTYRRYFVQGKLRATRFVPLRLGGDEPPASDLSDYSAGSSHGPSVSGPTASSDELTRTTECSTEFDGTTYVGECASQQEIDDAIALAVAMDVEISADWTEAQSSCNTIYGSPQCYYDQNDASFGEVVVADVGVTVDAGTLFGTPVLASDDAHCSDHSPITTVLDRSSAELLGTMNCMGEAIAATGAVTRWVFAHGAALRLMTGAASSGVGAVVTGLVLGGLAAGWTVGSLLVCLS